MPKPDLQTYLLELCDRIDEKDPQIEAFLPEENRRERILEELKNSKKSSPLYGIPIGIKDIFNVDGFPTQAGSSLPTKLFEGKQSHAVTLLKNAGGIVMGKTVTAEMALREPGPTRNPHNVNHTPGGSSSGSAAAVAAGFCPAAIGTQTIGSIIRPASYCGVLGFKPTFGRTSLEGVVPLSPSMDHVGWFTQDFRLSKIMASVLVANWNPREPEHKPTLGVPDDAYFSEVESETQRMFRGHLTRLEEAGYQIKKTKALADLYNIGEKAKKLLCAEMARVHEKWFPEYESLYRPGTAQAIRDGQKITIQERKKLRIDALDLLEKLEKIMNNQGIDLWVSPSATGPAPKGIKSTGNRIMSSAWNYVGFPAMNLPVAKAKNGLPVGFQLIGPTMSDESLLAWSEAIYHFFK